MNYSTTTKRFRMLSLLLGVLLSPWMNGALPEPVENSVPVPGVVGMSRLSVFIWDVYDIVLYAPNGQFNNNKSFALHLAYLRSIPGEAIAEKSVEEMRKQGVNEVRLAAWYVQMKEIFPDVDRGTELIGVFSPGKPTRFYMGSEFIGQVMDPEFGNAFSRIWLGEQTSLPDLRASLIGEQG